MKPSNILVTGGAGFIGSHVVDALVAADHTVTVLDDLSSGLKNNIPTSVNLVVADVRDRNAVETLLQKGKFRIIVHLAAQINVRKAVEDPGFDASVNVIGFLNLLESAVRSGVERVIFSSTGGAIYGEQDYFPADELHPTRPISPYGVSKLASEAYMYYYHAVHGLDTVALRYANVYGPRQNPHGEAGVVAIFATRLLKGERAIINGAGTQTRDFVYVDDVVRANMLSLACKGHNVFNVGTGVETDVNGIFRLINETTGNTHGEIHGPGMEGEQMRSVLSYGKIEKELGWSPGVMVREGLARTVDFFKARPKSQ